MFQGNLQETDETGMFPPETMEFLVKCPEKYSNEL